MLKNLQEEYAVSRASKGSFSQPDFINEGSPEKVNNMSEMNSPKKKQMNFSFGKKVEENSRNMIKEL